MMSVFNVAKLSAWMVLATLTVSFFASTRAEAFTARQIYEFSKNKPDVAALYLGGIIDAYARLCDHRFRGTHRPA